MARKNESKEVAVVKQETTALAMPDYLTGKEKSGMEALGKDDFKITRIKLLQPNSTEVRTFAGKALPTEFWHTGANKSLGTEFLMVPIIVSKRAILSKPFDDGAEILAYSKDAVHWDSGKDKAFTFTPKGASNPVTYKTGKDVQSSGLLNFGTSNPEKSDSSPAVTLFYDYLCYLPDYPELSPTVLSAFKTASNNARNLNTFLLSRRAPCNCTIVRVFAEQVVDGKQVWHIAQFDPVGNAPKEIFQLTEEIKVKYANYEAELASEDLAEEKHEPGVDDEIKY